MPGTPSWKEAISEPGAIENVYTSAVIVLVVAIVLVLVGTKVLPHIKSKPKSPLQQYKSFLIGCVVLILVGLIFEIPLLAVPPIFILVIAALMASRADPISNEIVEEEVITSVTTIHSKKQLTYNGKDLIFPVEMVKNILLKHFPYYNSLNEIKKTAFIGRLQKFIHSKTFIIHDESGFREMPILISAAAIQLSFGFEKYLIPDFPNIHIYPEEFIGVHPSIRYLEGNVSGNCINISWKHFLNGFKYPDDGQNVGLHEMAHAYHFQNFETGRQEDEDFTGSFPNFNLHANKAFAQESISVNDLYTDYALRNFQEFWAESVEIFFEKPSQMKSTYPELYTAMCDLMNQRPC